MARSREEVISEMVDSGLFSDDEIRSAAKQSPQPAQPPMDKYGDLKSAVSTTAHMTFPVIGAAGGAALTSPATFTGAPIVGGAAGYALGSGAARKLDDLMGMTKPLPLKQEFKATGNDLQTGAMAELLPAAATKAGGAVVRAVKENPQVIGSAIDAIGGLPAGTGRVALQNPEITKAGYFTYGKIKEFAGKLSENLNKLEEEAQAKWAAAREAIDASHGGAGKVDRFGVAKAIQEAKEQLSLKGPQYVPGNVSSIPPEIAASSLPSAGKLGAYGEELSPAVPVPDIPKSAPGKMVNKDSGSAAEAISKIESKFNSMLEPATYGGQQAKSRLNLRDLTDLRQEIDSHINWESNGGPAISKNEQRIFKGLRGQVDSLIGSTPEYARFKTDADAPFSDMINTSKQARSTFGIKAGKNLEDLTTDELKQIENKVKGTLKKGGAEREAISAMDKKIGDGMSILQDAEKLAASGGATPERVLPFERTLRPGTGYALLNSAGVGGAGASLALHHPAAAAGVLAGQGATMAMTSPRMIGAALRSMRPMINSAKAAAPDVSRELAALLSLALQKRRQNAQPQ